MAASLRNNLPSHYLHTQAPLNVLDNLPFYYLQAHMAEMEVPWVLPDIFACLHIHSPLISCYKL